MQKFISNIKTAVIATLDEDKHPFSSYAPYIYDENRFYIYISDIATHAKNIQKDPKASLFFIEDESKSDNLFARRRVSLQCVSTKIERGSERFEEVLGKFAQKFDASAIDMLKKMLDFNLYELKTISGEATFGFGEAYTIGGEDMNELVPREGKGHKKA